MKNFELNKIIMEEYNAIKPPKNRLIGIVNEEVSTFSPLNHDKFIKEDEINELINNEEFQKQFIIDSITNKNKIKYNVIEAHLSNEWEEKENGTMEIECYVDVQYTYDATKQPIDLKINFSTDNLSYSIKNNAEQGNYTNPSSNELWFEYINWADINVDLFDANGDNIKFTALEKSPVNIYNLFVRSYTESFIEKEATTIENKSKY
jgi:hypothetical protein